MLCGIIRRAQQQNQPSSVHAPDLVSVAYTLLGMRLLCSKIYLLCYSAMLRFFTDYAHWVSYYAFNYAVHMFTINDDIVRANTMRMSSVKYNEVLMLVAWLMTECSSAENCPVECKLCMLVLVSYMYSWASSLWIASGRNDHTYQLCHIFYRLC